MSIMEEINISVSHTIEGYLKKQTKEVPNIHPRSIVKGDCWEWQLSIGTHGYGQLNIASWMPKLFGNRKVILAHIASHIVFNDTNHKINAQVVMHLCHNKKCINPNHLKSGSMSENMLGTRGGQGKNISTEIIQAIRNSNLPYRELANIYGISNTYINRIYHNKMCYDPNYIITPRGQGRNKNGNYRGPWVPNSNLTGYIGVRIHTKREKKYISYGFLYNSVSYFKGGFETTYEAAVARNLKIIEMGLQDYLVLCDLS